MEVFKTGHGYAPLLVNLCDCWHKSEAELTVEQRKLIQVPFFFPSWDRTTRDARRITAALFDYYYDPDVPKLAHAEQLRSLKFVAEQIAMAKEQGDSLTVATLERTREHLAKSAGRLGQHLRTCAQAFAEARGEPRPYSPSQPSSKALNAVLAIVETLCATCKIDITRPAKAARIIYDHASAYGISIGESTVEEYLKAIPLATAGRKR